MYSQLSHLPLHEKYNYILLTLDQIPDSLDKISITSNILGCTKQTIRNAINWRSHPTINFDKRGPKCVLKQHHIDFIETNTLAKRDLTNRELINMLLNHFQDLPKTLSEQTIMRARKKLGFLYLPPLRSCKLSNQAIQKRITFAQYHINNRTDFRNVIFTDESWFELGANRRWIYRKPGEISNDVTRPYQAHPPKVMIWGGIGYNFKSKLIFIDQNVDSFYYVDSVIIGSNVINDADERWGINQWVLQQDNARPHIATQTLIAFDHFLEINYLEDWPPCSPDINPIEVIWAIMKKRIEKINPKNLSELKTTIQQVWDDLTFETINRLIDSVGLRVKTIVANGGATIQKLN